MQHRNVKMSKDDFVEDCEELMENGQSIFMIALVDNKFEMRSFGVDFNQALVVKYLTEMFVDEKFVEMQAGGQEGN